MYLGWGSELHRPFCGSQTLPRSRPLSEIGLGEGEKWGGRAGIGFEVS